MSGLFNYYLRCSGCGLTSPIFTLVPAFHRQDRFDLPTADRSSGRFERTEVAIEPGDRNAQLRRFVEARQTPLRALTVPDTIDLETVRLQPPLACPRCGQVVDEGVFGSPPWPKRAVGSIEELLDRTRASVGTGDYELACATTGLTIRCCCHGVDANLWFVRGTGVALGDVVGELRARLRDRGSRCSEPKIRPWGVRFREWFEAEEPG